MYRRKGESDDSDDKEEPFKPAYRLKLPSDMIDRSKLSIWSLLKQCLDKELYRFTIPIIWNEPLSLLQRMAESMRYAELLSRATLADTPEDRMKFVVGFVISSQSVNMGRLSKPFNPYFF